MEKEKHKNERLTDGQTKIKSLTLSMYGPSIISWQSPPPKTQQR
jgi:hypothetical protein